MLFLAHMSVLWSRRSDPGASGGLDLDSDFILELAQEHPNICGVKLTCGNVGKLTRIADGVTPPASFAKAYPRRNKDASTVPFLVLGGFCDFLVPGLYANAHGAITGLGNLVPVSQTLAYIDPFLQSAC